jgi:hypothetical protein
VAVLADLLLKLQTTDPYLNGAMHVKVQEKLKMVLRFAKDVMELGWSG